MAWFDSRPREVAGKKCPVFNFLAMRLGRAVLSFAACIVASATAHTVAHSVHIDAHRGPQTPPYARLIQDANRTWWFEIAPLQINQSTSNDPHAPDAEPTRFVSRGMDHVMYSGDRFGPEGSPYEQAVTVKYHNNRTAWAEATVARIDAAGFNTLGSWSSASCPDCWETDGAAQAAAIRRGLFYTPIILFATRYNHEHNTTGFPDVFAPTFNASAAESARLVCGTRADDSAVLGYFLDNENSCPPTGTTVGNSVLDTYLALATGSPGRTAAERILKDASDANAEGVRARFAATVAQRYFAVTTSAIRSVDPNHLVLGCKFMSVSNLEPMVAAGGPYVDAHAIDIYAWTPGLSYLKALYSAGNMKPFVIAEFGFQARENLCNDGSGMGGAGPLVTTQAQRAAAWTDFVAKAVSLPFVVGFHHFQYTDQPWFPDDHIRYKTNMGVVSLNDTAYTTLLGAMGQTNARVDGLHALGAAGQRCAGDTGISNGMFTGYIVLDGQLPGPAPECLVAAADGTIGLGECSSEDVWTTLSGGQLQHLRMGQCLDINRASGSNGLVLTPTCTPSDSREVPASWEHGVDCLLMNYCRWLGTPVCGYEQGCITKTAGGVGTSDCIVGDPSMRWVLNHSHSILGPKFK